MNFLPKTMLLCVLAFAVFTTWAQNAQRVFEIASSSVIVVKTPTGQGSGVIFGVKRDGLTPTTGILTNCHVVKGHRQATVERLGKKSAANVLICDSDRDMALLEIGGELPFALRRTSPLKIGEPVYAIGAPQGLELSISEGIVSQLRSTDLGKDPLIQTTAAISPGSSGGGLFDSDGRLIGLTTMSRKEAQSLNFAVPWGFYSSIKNTEVARARAAATPYPNPATRAPALDSGHIANRYQVLGDGSVIKDIQTNLVWQRCSVGQSWDGNICSGDAKLFTFNEAQQLARNGWRVPTVRELASLIYCSNGTQARVDVGDGGAQITHYCRDNFNSPTIESVAFPRTEDSVYWTSSPYVGDSSVAWGASFSNGSVRRGYRYGDVYARLVR